MRVPMPRWPLVCALAVLPLTAVLHHTWTYPHFCLLNRFGDDYTPAVVAAWLQRDPALPWAIVLALALAWWGQHRPAVQRVVWAGVLAFLPLAVWLWDIPGTGRMICFAAHDARVQLAGVTLGTRHWYALGLVLWPLLVWGSWPVGPAQALRATRTVTG